MVRHAFARMAVATLLLAGCASSEHAPGDVAHTAQPREYKGSTALNVIGTPFYALFKVTGCILTAVVVAPGSALIEMTDRPTKDFEQAQLSHGLRQNCGGSYYLGS